ncbi:hypothetical protein ECG_08302 [Echinococcus granulosus]|nr:hypothetical protein ECG_08302 [Echinococcus granulosus]
MPFKIPRLEVKFASQRCGSFTQDSSCSSSQFDLLGNNYCSQNSRDSAIDSSQPEKPDSGGFWTSLRGSVDNERRNSVATNPPIGNAAPVIKIVDDIWDTVTELDALYQRNKRFLFQTRGNI